MRIIYLHQYFNTPEMAGGTRSFEMARRLVNMGHQVDMVTTWREDDGRKDWFKTHESGITVHWQPVEYSNRMGFFSRVRAFLKFALGASRYAASLSGDIVFATSTPLTIAIPAIYVSRLRRLPMVFEIRDVWPEVPIALGILKNPLLIVAARLLERMAYRSATRVVALAPGMKEHVISQGIDEDQVDVIPNGADIELFSSRGSSEPLEKRNNPERLVLYAGTIGQVNDVRYIVDLANEVRMHPDAKHIHFVIIGDGKLREDLEAYAHSLALGNRIRFLGSLPKIETARWFRSSSATIMTYDGPEIVYRDSVSNKFFDSLAAGKPVFANFSGFSTQLAEKHGAGIILPRNTKAAAQTLIQHMNDDQWLTRSGKNSRDLGAETFSRDNLAKDLEVSLHRALATQ